VCSPSACRTAVLHDGRGRLDAVDNRYSSSMAARHLAFWGRVGSTETGRTPERVWEGIRRCQLVVTGQSLFGGRAPRGGLPARAGGSARGCARRRFVGGDAQTLPGDAAKEMQWKQAVVATDQDPRWGVRPGSERRRFPHPGLRLDARPVQRLGGLWRDILVEEGDGIVVPVLHPLAVSRMGPVAVGRLSRCGGSCARPGRAVPQPPCRRRAGRFPERPRR